MRADLDYLFSPGSDPRPFRNRHARPVPGLSAFPGPPAWMEAHPPRRPGTPGHRRTDHCLVLFFLTRTPQGLLDSLRVAGGLFILYLARGIFLTLRRSGPTLTPSEGGGRQTFLSAMLMNFLNPNPYIFWGVVAGPIVLTGWRTSPALGIAFISGFYGTFICGLAVLIIVFASAGKLGARISKILGGIAGLALAVFGIYQISTGLAALI